MNNFTSSIILKEFHDVCCLDQFKYCEYDNQNHLVYHLFYSRKSAELFIKNNKHLGRMALSNRFWHVNFLKPESIIIHSDGILD